MFFPPLPARMVVFCFGFFNLTHLIIVQGKNNHSGLPLSMFTESEHKTMRCIVHLS